MNEKNTLIKKPFDLDDVMKLSAIIDKMEIEPDVIKIGESIRTAKLENKQDGVALGKEIIVGMGIDLAAKVVRKLHKAKDEIKDLISGLTEKSIDEVGRMGLKDMTTCLVDMIGDDEFLSFFDQASSSPEATPAQN